MPKTTKIRKYKKQNKEYLNIKKKQYNKYKKYV